MKKGRRKERQQRDQTRINEEIDAKTVRVLDDDNNNLGEMPPKEALKLAMDRNLDLVEIAPNAKPPVAKVTDYGKFLYEQKKKQREIKAKTKTTETKSVQVKIGTSENDQMLKAKKAAEWLSEGHRVKVELFLKGRYKYMNPDVLKPHLEKFLLIIPYSYKVADEIKKVPKGFATVLEKDTKKNENKQVIQKENKGNEERKDKSKSSGPKPLQREGGSKEKES